MAASKHYRDLLNQHTVNVGGVLIWATLDGRRAAPVAPSILRAARRKVSTAQLNAWALHTEH